MKEEAYDRIVNIVKDVDAGRLDDSKGIKKIMKVISKEYNARLKESKFDGFEYKCSCWWSKNDKYGFMSNTHCPAHGKQARKLIKDSVEVSKDRNCDTNGEKHDE